VQSALDKKPIAWQPFATDDLAHVVGEVLQRWEAAGPGMKVFEIKTPAASLVAAMLAHEPIEPALQAAG
jgi:hypothetical protein